MSQNPPNITVKFYGGRNSTTPTDTMEVRGEPPKDFYSFSKDGIKWYTQRPGKVGEYDHTSTIRNSEDVLRHLGEGFSEMEEGEGNNYE